MDVKTLPTYTKDIDGRSVVGIFAVHGHRDSYDDISHPGSFGKTLAEGKMRLKYLWQHDFNAPPVAAVKSIREVGRDALPDEVLQRAPDATGGVEVVREYLDTPRGNEVLTGIKAGAIQEQSYGYDAVKFDFNEVDGITIRNLREVRLYEVSDVLWGANDATLASKATLPIEFLLKQFELHLKAGARHSAADIERLNAIAQHALELGATNIKLLDQDEPKAAEPVLIPLTALRQRLRLFELEV